MYQYSLGQWLLYFFIYCILGWGVETTYVSLHQRRFVNRGFMRGPWLPIYGSGAIALLFCASPFMNYPILVFLSGMIGASILEYFTGMTMEALFKVRYWDYSKKKFNLNGHICLLNSFYWGILSLVLNYGFHKLVNAGVMLLEEKYVHLIDFFFLLIIVYDFALSFKAAMDMRNVLIQLEKAKAEIGKMQKRMDVLIAVASDEVKDEMDELRIRLEIFKDRVANAAERSDRIFSKLMAGNPTMTSHRFHDSFETLKQTILNRNIRNERK